MTVAEFTSELTTRSVDQVTRDVVLGGAAVHVKETDRKFISKRVSEVYNVAQEEVGVWIVGSAKLGFSISEKRTKTGKLPRYRAFRPESDIDVAVVSRPVYDLIHADLSRYAYSAASRLPWDSGNLGHYMVHGWVRPDYFPNVRLRQCDAWRDFFRRLSGDPRFRRRRVNGGLFYSFEDLVHYQSRAVTECRQAMELHP